MAPPDRSYRLSPRAFEDLEDIWQYGAENWSAEQADRYVAGLATAFQMIAEMPGLARERQEFQPPVRMHPHGSHLIVYTASDEPGRDDVVILRLLGGHQDWRVILRALD